MYFQLKKFIIINLFKKRTLSTNSSLVNFTELVFADVIAKSLFF